VSKALYHDFAENMPIIGFHCRISPREIAEDRKFENITQAQVRCGAVLKFYVIFVHPSVT